jgi:uncharacterized RDD family membrane protein YckC
MTNPLGEQERGYGGHQGPWEAQPPIPQYDPQARGPVADDPAPWAAGTHRMAAPSGSPQPAPTAGRYADWGERVAATLTDGVLVLAVVMVGGVLTDLNEAFAGLMALALFATLVSLAWLNGSRGMTPGKALMGLRVVRASDRSLLGGPVGLLRAVLLGLMATVSGGFLAILSLLWPLWGRRRQTLHDKLTNAVVLGGYPRARIGRNLFRP